MTLLNYFYIRVIAKVIERQNIFLLDGKDVKEIFQNRKMYYNAIKSYCKNKIVQVERLLGYCIVLKTLKHMMRDGLFMPNPNVWWENTNTDYPMRNILSDLIDIYTDQ